VTKLATPIRRKLIFDGQSSTTQYLGEAPFGATTSDSVWRITRLSYSGTDNAIITIEYPNASDEYHFIWDNRALLTYS
jgi:hypothetical protein